MTDDQRGNVTVVSTPEPVHRCDLPGQLWNQHWERVGTVIACKECGQHWISERHPRVTAGSQMTGNRWVKTRKPKAPRRRPAGNADAADSDWPPTPLIACALLWIGMAMDHYLPDLWLNIIMAGMVAVVAVVAVTSIVRRIQRRKAE